MKQRCFITILLSVLICNVLWAFDHERNIIILGDSKYKYFYIPEDIYKYTREDLGDIRLYDETGKELQYVIKPYKNTQIIQDAETYRGKIISDTITTKNRIITFSIDPLTQEQDIYINNITANIKLPHDEASTYQEAQEFLSKECLIYGSDDSKNWIKLFANVTHEANDVTDIAENMSIIFDLEPVSHKYYRIVTYSYKGVDFLSFLGKNMISVPKNNNEEYASLDITDTSEKGSPVTTAKINTKHLPLTWIRLYTSDTDLDCTYIIKNTDNNEQLTGKIYRLGNDEDMMISLRDNIPKGISWIELMSNNKDKKNRPIITGAQGIYHPHMLIFKVANSFDSALKEKGKRYTLKYGDPAVSPPQYDLEQKYGYHTHEANEDLDQEIKDEIAHYKKNMEGADEIFDVLDHDKVELQDEKPTIDLLFNKNKVTIENSKKSYILMIAAALALLVCGIIIYNSKNKR